MLVSVACLPHNYPLRKVIADARKHSLIYNICGMLGDEGTRCTKTFDITCT